MIEEIEGELSYMDLARLGEGGDYSFISASPTKGSIF